MKENKLSDLTKIENATTYATISKKETRLHIEDVTQYYIEHIYCDYQTFLHSLNDILAATDVKHVLFDKNKIKVELFEKDDIEIELEEFTISVTLFGIYKNTPTKTVEEIMTIYKNHINSLVDKSQSIYEAYSKTVSEKWQEEKAQSIALLDKYKDSISSEAYERLLYVIGSQALSGHFVDEKSIKNMIRIENAELTTYELIEELKQYFKEKEQ